MSHIKHRNRASFRVAENAMPPYFVNFIRELRKEVRPEVTMSDGHFAMLNRGLVRKRIERLHKGTTKRRNRASQGQGLWDSYWVVMPVEEYTYFVLRYS